MQLELKRIHQDVGLTFLYVTHDQEEAMVMSDRLAVMNGGRIEQLASPEDVYERPATEFVASFLGASKVNYYEVNQDNAPFYSKIAPTLQQAGSIGYDIVVMTSDTWQLTEILHINNWAIPLDGSTASFLRVILPCRRPGSSPGRCSCSSPTSATSSTPRSSGARTRRWSATSSRPRTCRTSTTRRRRRCRRS